MADGASQRLQQARLPERVKILAPQSRPRRPRKPGGRVEIRQKKGLSRHVTSVPKDPERGGGGIVPKLREGCQGWPLPSIIRMDADEA